MSSNEPAIITQASAAVAALPDSCPVTLSGGQQLEVRRLSWLAFEAVWAELAVLLTAVLTAGEDAGEEEILARLSGAPATVLRLACLSTDVAEGDAARWPFDDVLAVGAAALRLNFIDSSGLRSFFVALGSLAAAGQPKEQQRTAR
jgi:hypothetical protein